MISEPGCSFCAIVAGRAPAEIVHEDEWSLGFMDALPMTGGHALLVPKPHVRDLLQLGGDLAGPLLSAASDLGRRIVAATGARGLNLLNNNGHHADQSQFHLHFHLVPRYGRDRLLHPFERSFGDWGEIARLASAIRAVTSESAAAISLESSGGPSRTMLP